MEYLQRLERSGETSLYEIRGGGRSPVARYVASTAEGRRICNQPELIGFDFGVTLTRAVTHALELLPERDAIETGPQERICVVHFLRGGLNFGLREALYRAYGFNRQSSVFMSSQRKKVDGEWHVEEDMYRKLEIPAHATLLVGDVVATGTTVANGLDVILHHLRHIGSSVRRIVFFTIGCARTEQVLAEADRRFRAAFEEYEGTAAVYLEGRFRLVSSGDELRIGRPGTDLIRRDCLVAPEFALAQYDRLSYALERCTIYDAGSRAFDIPTFATDVRSYWEQVRGLALGGTTLAEALDERWPEPWRGDHDAFDEWAGERWRGVDDDLLDAVWRRSTERWSETFRRRAAGADALAELATGRLGELPDVRRERSEG